MSICREELRKLPLAERLALGEEEMAELDRRLADYQANPDEGIPWEEVRDRIRNRK